MSGAKPGPLMNRQDINRLVLEYLIVEGYKDAAEKFSAEIGVTQPLSDVQPAGASLVDRMWVREAVLDRRIDETIAKINDLWPELFEQSPVIYFQLRQLQMLELIREGKSEEALNFAQMYLADPVHRQFSDHPQLLHEIQNTMALLAFDNPSESIYGNLLNSKHAEIVAGSLNRAILRYIDCGGGSSKPSTFDGFTSAEQFGVSSTVPRLTKMMAMLLHFRDLAQLDLPAELASL